MTPLEIFLILVIIVLLLVLAWNLMPSVRESMRGFSTILETILAGLLAAVGAVGGAFEEARASGLIPDNWGWWVGITIIAYIVVKRFQTKTPVGG